MWVIARGWPAGGAPLGLPWWGHLLLLAAVAFEIACRALKITFSARAIGISMPVGVATRTILGGDFAASITPSRSGAEPARFLVLTEARVPVASVLLILFLELFLELVSLVLVVSVLAVVMRGATPVVRGLIITVGSYALGLLAIGALTFSLARNGTTGDVPRWLGWCGVRAGRWRRIQGSLRQLRDGVESLRSANRSRMLVALAFSVLHVSARLVALPIIVASYGGVGSVAMGPLILWPMLLLYGAAIAPAPGGGGMVELAFSAALGRHIPGRLLAASLIWWRTYTFYIYIAIGALAAGGTVLRALRRTARAIESDGGPEPGDRAPAPGEGGDGAGGPPQPA